MNSIKPIAVASAIQYDLRSLGWKAFQQLCVTLVSNVWGQTVQSFHDSHDGGRDGAFQGAWINEAGKEMSGSFTVQCKFTAVDKRLTLSQLSDELNKARSLAERGLASNYFLFTNASLTASNEARMRKAFEDIPGLSHFAAYGIERISLYIRESPRLRMLVPRLYGIGDLSLILDERSLDQAQEILSSLGNDLNKFVMTDAFTRSAKAIVEHGFVFLLGEPACGKSTIAAALAIGALDQWKCSTIKVRSANEFVTHSNPHLENQFFWVDDVFGATQLDTGAVHEWNSALPHLNAAIKRGARFVFTSRDYIYKQARDHLKESAFPALKESQIVINVEELSGDEREQILYNHLRLGTQPREFLTAIKPYLPSVAHSSRFSPETARRLGNPFFTKELGASRSRLMQFVEKPMPLLIEIIRTIDADCRAAIAVVFMRGGILPSPVTLTDGERAAIELIGGSAPGVLRTFRSLSGSLLIETMEHGSVFWRYKHPTIRDAFASLVAEDRQLMDIYLTGTPLEKVFQEVSCGEVGVDGIKLVVPNNRNELLIARVIQHIELGWYERMDACRFLSSRCDREFLVAFMNKKQDFVQSLQVGSYMYVVPDIPVLVRLNKFGLLAESDRLRHIDKMRELALEIPDSGFLNEEIRSLFQEQELIDTLREIESKLLPSLAECVDEWADRLNDDDDPEEHFYQLKQALRQFRSEFSNNEAAIRMIDAGINRIDEAQSDALERRPWDDDNHTSAQQPSTDLQGRSVFDDVDC